MSENLKKVLIGWSKLTIDEKKEFLRIIEEDKLSKGAMIAEMYTGPIGEGCPCCGR